LSDVSDSDTAIPENLWQEIQNMAKLVKDSLRKQGRLKEQTDGENAEDSDETTENDDSELQEENEQALQFIIETANGEELQVKLLREVENAIENSDLINRVVEMARNHLRNTKTSSSTPTDTDSDEDTEDEDVELEITAFVELRDPPSSTDSEEASNEPQPTSSYDTEQSSQAELSEQQHTNQQQTEQLEQRTTHTETQPDNNNDG